VAWQPETTVAETVNVAVAVAASAGLKVKPDTRKPKMNANNLGLMRIAILPARNNCLKISYRHFLESLETWSELILSGKF
jgi:hypothetical protein